ncbi:MAG: hypothetical protein AB7P02_26995 [Alphaproteobacteria bacterium]
MLQFIRAAGAAALLAGCAPQVAHPGGDPADPRAVVPAPSFTSPLIGQGPFAPAKPRSWRDLNNRAGRLGGARGQMEGDPEADAPAKVQR